MSTVFFTSDMHIGHRKVAVERVQMRPDVFGEFAPETDEDTMIEAHDRIMGQRWDSVVTKDDVVWVVGDISSGANSAIRRSIDWVAERSGRKFMVAGNHDPVHESSRTAHKWIGDFAHAFEWVASAARVKIAGRDVMVSHYPYVGDHTPTDRDVAWRKRDEGMPIVHGHTHATGRVTHTPAGTVQVHVGVDAWDFTPVPIDKVAEHIGVARQP